MRIAYLLWAAQEASDWSLYVVSLSCLSYFRLDRSWPRQWNPRLLCFVFNAAAS